MKRAITNLIVISSLLVFAGCEELKGFPWVSTAYAEEYTCECNCIPKVVTPTPTPTPSPTPIPSGDSDLIVSSVSGMASSYELGMSYYVSVTIKNQGTEDAGQFTLMVYQNVNSTIGGTVLHSATLSGLEAGRSTIVGFTLIPRSTCSIHTYCKFIFMADADNQVNESNESNNTYTRPMLRAR